MNLHDRSTGERFGSTVVLGTSPGVYVQLEAPLRTKKIRFRSKTSSKFHIREFRIFGVGSNYPDPLSTSIPAGLTDYARTATVKVSGSYNNSSVTGMVDNNMATSWISQEDGEKWIEFTFPEEKVVGCVQFVNGWKDGNNWSDAEGWNSLISDYVIEYQSGTEWVPFANMDVEESYNLAKEFHTYGLEWTPNELIYYFDRKIIRRISNSFCHAEAPVFLSSAIIGWDGPVTDAIDGTQMEVDYVRIYKRKE